MYCMLPCVVINDLSRGFAPYADFWNNVCGYFSTVAISVNVMQNHVKSLRDVQHGMWFQPWNIAAGNVMSPQGATKLPVLILL